MLGSPRVWLWAAGGWLVVAGLGHGANHLWSFVLENGMVGLLDFAMNAAKQAQSPDLLRPSLWRQFRAFSAALALLLLFAGGLDIVLAQARAPAPVVRALALFQTVFWTGAFAVFAFVDPVILPLLASLVAVPMHAIAYMTASLEIEMTSEAPRRPGRRSTPTADADR